MPTGTSKKGEITRREFEKRVAKLLEKHLATLPEEEQEARLQAAERRLAKISRDARTKDERVPEIPSIRLSSRTHRAER